MCPDSSRSRTEESGPDEASASHCSVLSRDHRKQRSSTTLLSHPIHPLTFSAKTLACLCKEDRAEGREGLTYHQGS